VRCKLVEIGNEIPDLTLYFAENCSLRIVNKVATFTGLILENYNIPIQQRLSIELLAYKKKSRDLEKNFIKTVLNY
jgi:hypothetical protein